MWRLPSPPAAPTGAELLWRTRLTGREMQCLTVLLKVALLRILWKVVGLGLQAMQDKHIGQSRNGKGIADAAGNKPPNNVPEENWGAKGNIGGIWGKILENWGKWQEMRKRGGNWGTISEKRRSPASGRGVGMYLGTQLSTEPSVWVSSATRDSLAPAFDKQDMHNCPFPHFFPISESSCGKLPVVVICWAMDLC